MRPSKPLVTVGVWGVYTRFALGFVCLTLPPPRFFLLSWSSPGMEGRCLHGNLWYSPPTSVTSRLTSVTFKIASKVFIEEKDKNFDLITEILIRFLGFGDFKVPIVIEN